MQGRPQYQRKIKALGLGLGVMAGLLAGPGMALAEGSAEKGLELARLHCARCHVVEEDRLFTGISSTPSFMLKASMDDWQERVESFYARPPHPPVARLPGIDSPTEDPPTTVPFEITIENVDDLVAYFRTLREEN